MIMLSLLKVTFIFVILTLCHNFLNYFFYFFEIGIVSFSIKRYICETMNMNLK